MPTAVLDFETLRKFADTLHSTVRNSGRVIMEIYESDFGVETKADKSPVTAADEASEAIILESITAMTPDIPFVAEEHIAAHGFPKFDGHTFWLIDALDGTKEFINKRSAFTVNVGLIIEGVPSLGLIYAPAIDEFFCGIVCPTTGERAASVIRNGYQNPMSVRSVPEDGVIVVSSYSHQIKEPMDEFLAKHTVKDIIAIGSSLKFCLIAEGKADLYPRFGPTSEWDIAAGHAVLRAAGGNIRTLNGEDMQYKKVQDNYLNGTFVAAGTP